MKTETNQKTVVAGRLPNNQERSIAVPSPRPSDGRGEGQGEVRAWEKGKRLRQFRTPRRGTSLQTNPRPANRPQFAASDLVSLVLERSMVFGCGSVNRNVNISQPVLTFPACAPVRPLLKRIVAATGLQCRDDCFFNAVYRMNKVYFTRREILEEVSPRSTIHPSIERTVSSHE